MTPEEFLTERRRIHGGFKWRSDDAGALYHGSCPLLTVTGGDPVLFDAKDATAIVDAHNTLPVLISALEKVLELHKPYEVYELDEANGTWVYDDDNGERKVIAKLCRECSSEESIAHVEDNEWRDTWDDGSAEFPCPTVRVITAALGGGE